MQPLNYFGYLIGVELVLQSQVEMVFYTKKPNVLPRIKNLYRVMDLASWCMLFTSCLATTLALLLIYKLEKPSWSKNTFGISWDIAMMPLGIILAENHFRWYDYTLARGKGTIIRAVWLICAGFMMMFFQSVLKVQFQL